MRALRRWIKLLWFLTLGVFCPALAMGQLQLTPKELTSLGDKLYNTPGANTCLMCHGAKGQGGSIAEAPKLSEPRNWNMFKALGGIPALQKERKKFLEDFATVNTQLILRGAIRFNKEFGLDYPYIRFDWSKADVSGGNLNPLMYGIQQAPTLEAIERARKGLVQQKNREISSEEMRQLAAKAIYDYVKTLDLGGPNGGVFKP